MEFSNAKLPRAQVEWVVPVICVLPTGMALGLNLRVWIRMSSR